MTKRQIVALAFVATLIGLVVAAMGVHMLAGLPAGLIAYGVSTVAASVLAVALWA